MSRMWRGDPYMAEQRSEAYLLALLADTPEVTMLDRQVRLSPRSRVDIVVWRDDAVELIEVKAWLVQRAHAAQAARYVEDARLLWPDVQVSAVLVGPELGHGLPVLPDVTYAVMALG